MIALWAFSWDDAYARRSGSAELAQSSVRVDSLVAAGRVISADSLLRTRLARLPLATLRDSLAAAQPLIRFFELTEEASPPFRPDSSRARAGVAFAVRLTDDAPRANDLVLRARLAGARCALSVGDPRTARSLLERALGQLASDAGADPHLAATRWILLARAYSVSSARDSALAPADSAVAIAERARLRGVELASIRGWQGIVWGRAGKYAPCASRLGEVIPQLSAWLRPSSPTIAQMRYVRAGALSALGDVQAAIAEYETLAASLEQCGEANTFTYAVVLEQLGARQGRGGDLVASRDNAERAVAVMRSTVGESHEDFGFANMVLGGALGALGDRAGAIAATRTAYQVMAARLGDHYLRLGDACNGMANLFRHADQLDSALAWLGRGREIYLAQPDSGGAAYLLVQGTLANTLGDLGRAAEALPIAASAAQRMERFTGPDHHYVSALLLVQAEAARAVGDTQQAGAVMDTVVARRIRHFGRIHPDVEDAIQERGYLRALQGDQRRASADALEAAEIGRVRRQALLRGLDERSALALLSSTRWTGLDLALTLLEGAGSDSLVARVYPEVIRQRAMLLEELLARQQANATPADSARSRRARLRAEAAGLILSGDKRAASILDSLSRVEAGLSLARGGSTTDGPAASGSEDAAQLIASRPAGASLVSYVRYQHVTTGVGADGWKARLSPAYAVFVVPAGTSRILFRPLGPAAPIDSMLSAWLAACAGNGPRAKGLDERSTGRALRRRILDPVLAATGGGTDLYMVLDGDLEFLDPCALPDDAGGYLLEHRPRFVRLLRENELLARRDARAGSGLVALGGADFDSRTPADPVSLASSPSRLSTCDAVELHRFEPLPASGAEVQAVARRWRSSAVGGREPVTLLVGRGATERAIRDSVTGRRVVHLATHGFVLDDSCEAWAPGAARVFRTLFRSGLVLAGANQRSGAIDPEDDGLLTAGEISTLDLRGAQWVCLSGCETGLGESVRGEGTYGLVRAFRLAGARQVLMSLWPVPDESAALWNDAFYAELANAGVGLDEAARRASLKRLRDLRREGRPTLPSGWDCFTAAGPDR